LAELGHDVVLGTRDPSKLDEKKNMARTLREWLSVVKGKARVATFQEAALHGELLINASHGQASVEALTMARAGQVGPKTLIDTANELDFSKGFPLSLASATRSVAEAIQKAFPNLRVVKSLNTLAAPLMVDPKLLKGGDHSIFVAGDDPGAKAQVVDLLKGFGWTDILDLGPLAAARGPEMYLGLWVSLYGSLKNGMINVKVVR
jgi:predicted dinucleotide-binding enzyme